MLIYSMGVSVDGFIADRDGETRTFGSGVIYERYVRTAGKAGAA